MFRKTASVESLGAFILTDNADGTGLAKTAYAHGISAHARGADASMYKGASYYLDGSTQIDVSGILARTAEKYAISKDPRDYVYEAIRANTVNVPNDNHDAFTRDELLRFVPRLKMAVYQTYREQPHHVNHRTENARTARGIILDAHYNDSVPALTDCPTKGCGTRTAERENRDDTGIHCRKCGATVKDEFVEILLGIDARKDPLFAEAVRTGELRTGSMGCDCGYTTCSVCNNVARTRAEFCEHVRNKGALYSRTSQRKADGSGAQSSWRKVSLMEVEREFSRRGYKFDGRDLVSLRAASGDGNLPDFEVVKGHEKCGDVEYKEYSRVDHPADTKAEQTEFFGRIAGGEALPDAPSPEALRSETEQLIARAKLRKARPKAAQAGAQWFVVRVDSDPNDSYAAPSLEEAIAEAELSPDSMVEWTSVSAPDQAAALAQASGAVDWQPYDGMGVEGDVTININEGPPGSEPTVETVPENGQPHQEPTAPPGGPTIEDFTNKELAPEPLAPEEELTPEELGVIPPGASKDADGAHAPPAAAPRANAPAVARSASMNWSGAYTGWKVQVSPKGNAQLVSPKGDPVLLFKAASGADKSDESRLAFGQGIIDHLHEHGLTRTAAKFEAMFAAKWASIVDFATDDMAEFADKEKVNSIVQGGELDHTETLGKPGSDVRTEAERDMAGAEGAPKPQVKDVRKDHQHDHAEQLGSAPDSVLTNPESDMRDERSKPPKDVLMGEEHDHAERVGKRVAHKEDAKRENWLIASYNRDTDKYTLVGRDLDTREVTAEALKTAWLAIDKPAIDPRVAAETQRRFEERLKRVYVGRQAAVEQRAREAAVQDVFRALRIAAKRHALNLEASPLKESFGIVLANERTVGTDPAGRPLTFEPLAPDLAVHLVEAAWKEGGANEIETLIKRASELMAKETEYLKSAEADLAKISHRIPPVTSATALSAVDAHAETLRREASAGNLELRSAAPASAPTNNARESIQAALGATRLAARRNQFRQ